MNHCKYFFIARRFFHLSPKNYWQVQKRPELEFSYLLNKQNEEEIKHNIVMRKGVGNIQLVNELKKKLDAIDPKKQNYKDVEAQFYQECLHIPNRTHPHIITYGEHPKVTRTIGEPKKFNSTPKEFHEISKRLNILRTDQLGPVSGPKSYSVQGELAELENALVYYTLDALKANNFQIVTVPDILHRDIIEACGLNTRGDRTQVYSFDDNRHGPDLCLSGTSEMALAAYFMNTVLVENDLPTKLATVSRCFRAETSNLAEERGIYRVHEFTKVEMFIVCKAEQSNDLLEDLRDFEENHFRALDLHLQTLDMPPHELGASAYRKYDVEAWMPGRKMFGEVSSCSNCTTYQSVRLNIKYQSREGQKFAHTLNGTACAIPRMLIALVETHQNEGGTVSIPDVLQKYMQGKKEFGRQKKVPELKLIKNKKIT